MFLKSSDHSSDASHFLDSSGGLFKVALHCLIISQLCQINPWELVSRSIGLKDVTAPTWNERIITITHFPEGQLMHHMKCQLKWNGFPFLWAVLTIKGTYRICQDEGWRFSPASLMLFTQTSSREWWGQALSPLKGAWRWKEVPASHMGHFSKKFLIMFVIHNSTFPASTRLGGIYTFCPISNSSLLERSNQGWGAQTISLLLLRLALGTRWYKVHMKGESQTYNPNK